MSEAYDLIRECEKNTFLVRAREIFRAASEKIEAEKKRKGDDRMLNNSLTHIRMEFEAVAEIAACLGLRLRAIPKPLAGESFESDRKEEDLL